MENINGSDGKKKEIVNKEIEKIDKSLSKQEILRGHLVFSSILRNSVLIRTDFLKVFLDLSNKDNRQIHSSNFDNSPLLTNNVKVGFIIAKKKIRKAFLRNRIKRLMKESYRLNKNILKFPDNLNIIFSLNEKGYEIFKIDKKIKIDFMHNEFKKSIEKLNKYFSEK
jgi:ribonuclease P protein component